ncbi:metallophosphoesterase family protein [Daejeonella lutea]|uniref:Predicted phosphodiesterase n=1 Tax=Daejeonella lutea TaxID=572036 RepID=A0A1T5FCE3_9SPHI|nr:metallophosphoesterase family protein [Daejeonella lutea]SKB93777.1 Predicted phosphodiesterase [Daejeonella lutea]
MKLGILSDIHSNVYALQAVVSELELHEIDKLIILGDTFGYYPWAHETYEALHSYLPNAICIKGNHDQLVIQSSPPDPVPSYWYAAKLNEKELREKSPEAIDWLGTLPFESAVTLNGSVCRLAHGTPADPENGRYYPDDMNIWPWFPKPGTMLLLGHTHYPVVRNIKNGGKIINPGSVGQPRDGNPDAAWGILDTETRQFEFKRTNYNYQKVMATLREINWDKRAIASLGKSTGGALEI